MLFDLISDAKVYIKIEYPNKILLFIENLCCCSLKIAVCVPKIPTGRKKIKIPVRLKITIESKNFGASVGKPSGVVQVFRTSERIAGSTGEDAGTHDQHTTTAGEQESRRAKTKKFFVLYIGIEKYLQKKLKKICRYRNLLYLCSRNQITNKFNNKTTKQ